MEINEQHQMNDIETFLKTKIEKRKVPGPWHDHENLLIMTPEKKAAFDQSKEIAAHLINEKEKKLTENKTSTYSKLKALSKLRSKTKKISVGLRSLYEGRYEAVLKEWEMRKAKKRSIYKK